MFATFKQIFTPRNKELRKRILFTLCCLAIFIIGTTISIPNTKGELAKVLTYMAEYEFYILGIEFGRQSHSYIQYCYIEFEINKSNIDEVRKIIERKVKVIEYTEVPKEMRVATVFLQEMIYEMSLKQGFKEEDIKQLHTMIQKKFD